MAADTPVKKAPVNPCCTVWKDKYSNARETRNILRQAIKEFGPKIDMIQAENLQLKQACEDERARAETEKDGKDKEMAARISLENEISALKSEIFSLQQKGGSDCKDKNEEVKLLQVRVSEGEKEISRLKELLEKEKMRADLGKKNAEVDKKKGEKEIKKLKELLEKEKMKADAEKKNAAAEKKRATEAWKYVKAEKSKADEERRLASIEGKTAEGYRLQLEALKKEADEAKSELVSESSKFEELNKKLEAEKKKVIMERKRADLEMGKAEEQRKLAEANRKNAAEEKSRAEELSQQLDDAKRKSEELQKEIHEFVSRNLGETLGDHTDKITSAEAAQMKRRLWLEMLKRNADESKLVLEFEANKRFEIEKQKAISEKKRADSEMVKAEEQRKLAEVCRKKAKEEKCRADQLSRQSEEDRRKIEELQRRIHELLSSKIQSGPSSISPYKDTNAETLNVKLLKEQLKFEKVHVKHVKQMAKLEKSRNSILQQELGHLKLAFDQFSSRLDVLQKCFSTSGEGIDDPEKAGDLVNFQRLKLKENLCGLEPFCKNGFLKPRCMTKAASDLLEQTLQQSAPLLPISGGNCAEYMSGIDSKLESLLGGSNQKMLQSSAINSSTSFSDGQLVGSQGRGSFSVAISSKLVEEDLNVQPTVSSMSGEVTKMRCNENLAVVAENSVGSPRSVDVVGVVNGHGRKRKRMIDGSLYSKGKKLHQQIENISNLHGDSYAKNDRLNKKIKTCHEEKVVLQHLCDSDEPKKVENVETKIHVDADFFRQDSHPANNIAVTAQAWREALNDSVARDLETMGCFDQVIDGNYMKLLDLDNAADEECYNKALEMPLSPTLPEIEFHDVETFDMDNFESLVEKNLCQGLSNEKENLAPFCSFDVINVEIDSNKSSLHNNEALVDSFDILGNNGKCQTKDSGAEVGKSDIPSSGDEGVKFPLDSELGSSPHGIPIHCIMFSDMKDNSSSYRIFCATTCMARCLLGTQTERIVHNILLALKREEKLLPKEKVCVFFSLLLLNFSAADLERSGNFLNSNFISFLDSYAGHITAVMSDVEARSVFAELCLYELFSLIEDFLIDGRVMVYTDESSQMLTECESRINILLDGLYMRLSSETASADQLVAGSIILASICTAIDHVGFICEASYNILRMCRHDTSVVLTILHVFAYLGGERYFTLKEQNLTMTALKSIVTVLERGSLSVAAASCLSSARGIQTEFHPCAKCPFSEDSASIDIVVSLLLEKLQNYAQTITMNQDLMEPVSLSNFLVLHKDNSERSLGHEEVHSVLDISYDASCCLNKCRMLATQSESVVHGTLCHLSDFLSVVELLACKMSWNWTCLKIVPQLLKILESSMLGNFSIAVVILLGQLGRLGLDAGGYEDKGVESLRSDLSAFLWRDTTIQAGLPMQIATVTALLGLLSLDFEEVIQSNVKLPAYASQSVPTDLIRKWFSLLSKEQQALSLSLLQPTGVITS